MSSRARTIGADNSPFRNYEVRNANRQRINEHNRLLLWSIVIHGGIIYSYRAITGS